MKMLYWLFFFVIFVIGVVFSINNLQPVAVSFVYFQVDAVPLALVMTLELFAGVLLGLCVGFIRMMRLRRSHAKLQRKLAEFETNLE